MRKLFTPVETAFAIECSDGLSAIWNYTKSINGDAAGIERLSIEPIASAMDSVPWNEDEGAPFTVYAHYKSGAIDELGMCNFYELPYYVSAANDDVERIINKVRGQLLLLVLGAVAFGLNFVTALFQVLSHKYLAASFSGILTVMLAVSCCYFYRQAIIYMRTATDAARVDAFVKNANLLLSNFLQKHGSRKEL